MSSELLIERRGSALLLTLSGPATRNALSHEASRAAIAALTAAAADDSVRCVVLRGDGEHFCAGGNLQRLAAVRERDPEEQSRGMEHLHGWITAMRDCPKPVIAAVEGFAAGAGTSLALACDLVVAADSARFVLSWGRIGLSPDGGCTWHLARALGRGTALRMAWLPEPMSAAEWAALGLVHEVVGSGQALTAALALAERLAQMAPNALASTKALLQDAPSRSLAAQLDAEREHFVRNLFHANGGEGIAAFRDKRPPRFV